ncbi:hypothetical protein [uncultured Chryseobacterium sp.]|uniref:hypothetical protein n=1 Tax=uncultured Chryseobacterium sp. TaxID=259322 RepID=UPI0025CCAF66|nr:hypothetical protein [uncultured Chryseobacterium sp.]
MKEESIHRLNNIFYSLKTEEEKIRDGLARKKSGEDLFLENFRTLCKNFIEPKMQEFRRMLKENRFGSKISFFEETGTGKAIHAQTHIKLQISRNVESNFYANDKFPHIMFVADKNLKRIGIHTDTIFQNGTGTAFLKPDFYTLETFDEETIETEIVDALEKILVNR